MKACYRESPRKSDNGISAQPDLDAVLASVAQRVRLEAGTELLLDNAVYFPLDGVATLILHRDQSRFQVGFGSRGDAIGVQKLFVPEFPHISAKVLQSGSFIVVAPQTLRRLLRDNGEFRERLVHHALRAAALYLDEAARTVALSLEQRVAHWITLCGKTLASDIIPITHRALAHTLGVRRSGVTVALHVLEGQHLIRSARARIEVIDGERLAAFSHPQPF